MSGRKAFILLTFSKRNSMNFRTIALFSLFLSFVLGVKGQQTNTQTYTLKTPYAVEKITPPKGKKVKNVILMIGDGMSLMHIYTAWTCNRGQLWLENAQYTGLSKTPCLKVYIKTGDFLGIITSLNIIVVNKWNKRGQGFSKDEERKLFF